MSVSPKLRLIIATMARSIPSLGHVGTLEGWVELQRASMVAEPWAWVFYGSFVLVAVFVVVNLFVAVVLSNLDQARRELAEESAEPTIADVLTNVRELRIQAAQDRRQRTFDSSHRRRRYFRSL